MKKKSEGISQLTTKELREQLSFKKKLDFLFDDPIPKDQAAREKYVSDVALAYVLFFQERLKHFIGLQMEELAQIGRSEKMNDMIRSNINCFRLIDEWFQRMTNEHLGNKEQKRNSLDVSEGIFINELKSKHGKIQNNER